MTDEKKTQEEQEGQEVCPKCGSILVEEDGEMVCPDCEGEIDFFGGEEDAEA